MPKITYMIASRNDGFCGDPMARLKLALRQLISVHATLPFFEVIVSDWGSQTPIASAIAADLPASGKIRFLDIPRQITEQFNCPFSEVHALNAAVRRSRGQFVARIDQDILVGPKFVERLQTMPANDPRAYFSLRRDLPPGVNEIDLNAPVFQNWDPADRNFLFGAVGILMAPRTLWHQTRGYFERLLFRNHMEHDLCLRFATESELVNFGPSVGCDFYHLWHERVTNRPDNPFRMGNEVLEAIRRGEYRNSDDWGLAGFKFDEVVR